MKAFWAVMALMAVFFVYIAIQMFAPLFGNVDILDTTYRYDKAIIELPDGSVIAGEVEKWNDYEGDVVQVKMGGKTYLTQYSNVVLIAE